MLRVGLTGGIGAGKSAVARRLAERGAVVGHESIRRWCVRFGAEFAAKLRKRRPRPG